MAGFIAVSHAHRQPGRARTITPLIGRPAYEGDRGPELADRFEGFGT